MPICENIFDTKINFFAIFFSDFCNDIKLMPACQKKSFHPFLIFMHSVIFKETITSNWDRAVLYNQSTMSEREEVIEGLKWRNLLIRPEHSALWALCVWREITRFLYGHRSCRELWEVLEKKQKGSQGVKVLRAEHACSNNLTIHAKISHSYNSI